MAILKRSYGHATQKAKEAVRVAALEEGLRIEETYTGKAFAAFLDFIKANKWVFLFFGIHSTLWTLVRL
ncbi:MAG: hypothetical protein C4291_01305 [Candidatus Dadabacteria bacterium]